VQIRVNSNSLPAHAEFSLQEAIREIAPGHREEILSDRLRELELEQFQMARPVAVLAAAYGGVLRDFIGEADSRQTLRHDKHASIPNRLSVIETLKKLDILDAQRRELAIRLRLNFGIAAPESARDTGGQLDSR
jgi:hypothetical protein